jgi:hypothetical protein
MLNLSHSAFTVSGDVIFARRRYAHLHISMRRELYMVLNETVKGRILTRWIGGVVREEGPETLQKAT